MTPQDIINLQTARRCMISQLMTCENKNCQNKLCPLNKFWEGKDSVPVISR
jgi:hypothetical protein